MELQKPSEQLKKSLEKGSLALLLEEEQFHITGYRVLRSFKGKGLLMAVKSELNGKLRIVYDTRQYRRLSAVLPDLTPGTFTKLSRSLLETYCEVHQNGYLLDGNVLIDLDLIFVNSSTTEAGLVYLPVITGRGQTGQLDSMERGIRELLSRIIWNYPQVLDENLCRFRDQLSIQSVPLAEGLKYLGAKSEPDDKHVIHERDPEPELKKHLPAETWLKLVRMDSSRIRTLRIPPLGATLGREPGKAQVILSDSNVSRAHCKFSCAKGKWYVEDLNSKNGTRLNGKQLIPGEKKTISHEDLLTIAKIQFKILVESDDDEM